MKPHGSKSREIQLEYIFRRLTLPQGFLTGWLTFHPLLSALCNMDQKSPKTPRKVNYLKKCPVFPCNSCKQLFNYKVSINVRRHFRYIAHLKLVHKRYTQGRQWQAEVGRNRQRQAEVGRGRQKQAEVGRGRQRQAEVGRGRQRQAKVGRGRLT